MRVEHCAALVVHACVRACVRACVNACVRAHMHTSVHECRKHASVRAPGGGLGFSGCRAERGMEEPGMNVK